VAVVLINKLHLEAFSETLKQLLAEELSAGNQVTETSSGWPKEQAIMVFLKTPFHKKYKADNVRYNELNDRHYWKAEYVDETTGHVLACGF
jgi:hypothetical protein